MNGGRIPRSRIVVRACARSGQITPQHSTMHTKRLTAATSCVCALFTPCTRKSFVHPRTFTCFNRIGGCFWVVVKTATVGHTVEHDEFCIWQTFHTLAHPQSDKWCGKKSGKHAEDTYRTRTRSHNTQTLELQIPERVLLALSSGRAGQNIYQPPNQIKIQSFL